MNLRITKEIKALLPAFGLTIASSTLLLIEPQRAEGWVLAMFTFGCVLMGAIAFGHEFQHRTASLLLTQPIPRTSVWKEKMQVLAGGLVIGSGVLGVAFSLFDRRVFHPEVQWMAFGLVPLCAFCAAPLWAMVCRNTLMAALLALLTPGAILMAVALVFDVWFPNPVAATISGVILLLTYCAVCLRLGYDMFKELQVVGSVEFSRELAMPPRLEALLRWPFKAISTRFTGPFASLIKKELRLQQINFLGAGLFLAVAMVGAFVYLIQSRFHWHYPVAEPVLGTDFALYMMLLPLIAGALCVAEEKAWGVADWHVTLPPSVLNQWSTKMLVALSTSLVLGLVLPAALALVGRRLFGAHAGETALPPMHFMLAFIIGQLLLTSLVIYSASLCRNTVGAIILALGMILGAGFLVKTVTMFLTRNGFLILHSFSSWSGIPNSEEVIVCGLSVEMFVLVCLLQLLAFDCYRRRVLTRGQLTSQALVLALTICLLTIAFVL